MVAAAGSLSRFRQRALIAVAITLVSFGGAFILLLPGTRPTKPFPSNVIRVAIDPSVPPFAFVNSQGAIDGIDADIARAIADALNVEINLLPIGFDALYNSLLTDQADIIVSTLIADPNRMADVLYTRPYYNAGLVLISDSIAIGKFEQLPGHSIAYEFGSVADSQIRRWARRVASFETQPYERPEYALDAVRLGLADAALVDSVAAQSYVSKYAAWRPRTHVASDMGYVIGVPITAPQTFESVSSALEMMISNGDIEAIIHHWFAHSTE